MLKQMRAAGKALTDVAGAGKKLLIGYSNSIAENARAGSAFAAELGKGLKVGLKEEWDGYGKTGQKVVVLGSVAIAAAIFGAGALQEKVECKPVRPAAVSSETHVAPNHSNIRP